MGICISGNKNDVADVVLLTKDADNAQMIAKEILSDSYVFHSIRNMPGYTGKFGDLRISIQGLGIGNVSSSIYVTELVREFKPKYFIKIDGCVALNKELKLGDTVLAQTVHTTSRINRRRYKNRVFPAAADFQLLYHSYKMAREQNMNVHVGPIVSIETRDEMDIAQKFAARGALCIDLEMSQVYTEANLARIPVVGIMRVFANEVTGERLNDVEMKNQYFDLANFALEMIQSYLNTDIS